MAISPPKPGHRDTLSGPKRFERVLTYAALTLAAVLFLLPGYWLVVSALKTQSRIFALPRN